MAKKKKAKKKKAKKKKAKKKKKRVLDLEKLRREYSELGPLAERLRSAVCEQVERLIAENDFALGVPIESRVKVWESIAEKLERKTLTIDSLRELPDLVGLRLILLFRRDVDAMRDVLSSTFDVVSAEDAGTRLEETQFGYQSVHLGVRSPEDWRNVPVFRGLDGLTVEIQLRTLAQHIWAAASHKLQYKQEQGVPKPVRRTIYRVSALLETVDLELERVLDARTEYLRSGATEEEDRELNVDLLRTLTDALLPTRNRSGSEDYSVLLGDLMAMGIGTEQELSAFVAAHLEGAVKEDQEALERRRKEGDLVGTSKERMARGVYYTHVGLLRMMLAAEFGDTFRRYRAFL